MKIILVTTPQESLRVSGKLPPAKLCAWYTAGPKQILMVAILASNGSEKLGSLENQGFVQPDLLK